MSEIKKNIPNEKISFRETKEDDKRTELLNSIFTKLAKKLSESGLPFSQNLKALASTTTPEGKTSHTSFQEAINKPGLIKRIEKEFSENHVKNTPRKKPITRKTESLQTTTIGEDNKTVVENRVRITDDRSISENPNHPKIDNIDAKVQLEILETETKTKVNLVLPLELILGDVENSSWKMTSLKEKFPLLERILQEQRQVKELTVNKLEISNLPTWLQLEIEIEGDEIKITKLKTQHIKDKLELHYKTEALTGKDKLKWKKQIIVETDHLTKEKQEKKFLPMSSLKARSPEEWKLFSKSLETKKEK